MKSRPQIKSSLIRNRLALSIAFGLLLGFTACKLNRPTGLTQIFPTSTSPSASNAVQLPTPTKSATPHDACWPMGHGNIDLPGSTPLSGSLFYEYAAMSDELGIQTGAKPAVLNLKTGKTKGLWNIFSPQYISPDGKIIITEFGQPSWKFLTEKGELSYPIGTVTPLKSVGFKFLSDHQLLLEGPSLNEKYDTGNGIARDMYTFSFDTGKATFLRSVFLPYHILASSETSHNNYGEGLYSTNLKYILYPADDQGEKAVILLDVESQKIIWRGWPRSNSMFSFTVGADPRPIWRTDSSGIILYKADENTGIENFYNLSIDGQVSQLTHLEDISPSLQPYSISGPALSPNGQYLAFAISHSALTFPVTNSLLLILDLKTGAIINPCVPLEYAAGGVPYPIWSSDSNAIAVFPDAGGDIVAVDLKEKTIYNIFPKTGLFPGSLLGWIDWEIP